MGLEIERKFLVNKNLWQQVKPAESKVIRQGYLLTDRDKTIRVRISANQGFLTIKGKTQGYTRHEFEYEIPVDEARELIDQFAEHTVDKTRHYIYFDHQCWEVDEFHGENEGLLMAELELDTPDAIFKQPDWIMEEVTDDARYYNVNLALHPFKTW